VPVCSVLHDTLSSHQLLKVLYSSASVFLSFSQFSRVLVLPVSKLTDIVSSQLLAEAQRQILDPANEEKVVLMETKDSSDVVAPPEPATAHVNIVPEWAQPLENVRKLPTNVGTRIRKCIFESLERNPPDWAKKILEHSISKEVYKGNASGPTKVSPFSVLQDQKNILLIEQIFLLCFI
jgi:hypothetical protein